MNYFLPNKNHNSIRQWFDSKWFDFLYWWGSTFPKWMWFCFWPHWIKKYFKAELLKYRKIIKGGNND